MNELTSTEAVRRVRRVLRRARPAAQPPSEAAAPAPPPPPGDVLFRVAATCPRCGARPALRATHSLVRALAGVRPEERMGTYQCQRRGCGAVYDLTARAFQDAPAAEQVAARRAGIADGSRADAA